MGLLIIGNKICIIINEICKYICVILTGILVSLISIAVFYRYILQNALSWPEEIAGFCFVWLTMLGAVMCLFNKAHIGVSVLVNKFPLTLKKAVYIFMYILMLIFSYLIMSQGYLLLGIVSKQLSPTLRLNMGIEYFAIPLTGLIFLIYLLVSLLNFIISGNDEIRSDF